MPAVGLEPTRPRGQQILSLPCMPFHHAGADAAYCALPSLKSSRESVQIPQEAAPPWETGHEPMRGTIQS